MATTKKTPSSIWANYRKIIGPSKPLPVADLPTLRDTLQQVLLLKESSTTQAKTCIFDEVVKMVIDVWSRANYKLVAVELRVTDWSLSQRIKRAWDNIPSMALGGHSKKRKRVRGPDMNDKLDKLFNILLCTCAFLSCEEAKCALETCDSLHFICSCPREQKVFI